MNTREYYLSIKSHAINSSNTRPNHLPQKPPKLRNQLPPNPPPLPPLPLPPNPPNSPRTLSHLPSRNPDHMHHNLILRTIQPSTPPRRPAINIPLQTAINQTPRVPSKIDANILHQFGGCLVIACLPSHKADRAAREDGWFAGFLRPFAAEVGEGAGAPVAPGAEGFVERA